MNVRGVNKGMMSCAAKPVTKYFVVLVSNEIWMMKSRMKFVIRLLKVKIGSVFFCNKQLLHNLPLQYQAVKDSLKARQIT